MQSLCNLKMTKFPKITKITNNSKELLSIATECGFFSLVKQDEKRMTDCFQF